MLTLTLLAGGGAALGALTRYGIMQLGRPVNNCWPLPLTTLIINLSGSFGLGLLLASHLSITWQVLLGTGLMGGYTTFSTMINEVVLLVRNHHRRTATYYLLLSIIGGIGLAWLGTYCAF